MSDTKNRYSISKEKPKSDDYYYDLLMKHAEEEARKKAQGSTKRSANKETDPFDALLADINDFLAQIDGK